MPFNKKLLEVVLSNINQMELYNKIKFIRLSKNLTQGYIADELGIDVANYSRLERGETSITIDRLQKIADLLEVEITELILNKDTSSDNPQLESYLKEILVELKNINSKLINP